jgi:hypothetical protein
MRLGGTGGSQTGRQTLSLKVNEAKVGVGAEAMGS